MTGVIVQEKRETDDRAAPSIMILRLSLMLSAIIYSDTRDFLYLREIRARIYNAWDCMQAIPIGLYVAGYDDLLSSSLISRI